MVRGMSGESFDFGKLTNIQRDALGSAAFGGHGDGFSSRTLESLRERGLVIKGNRTLGHDRFGPIVIADWWLPDLVHLDFCQWCADHVEEPA